MPPIPQSPLRTSSTTTQVTPRANAIGMSKGGLYAHFGSKQELQLATIDAARGTFVEEVLRPALSAPRGIQRLLAICETYLSHIERRVFPGGCFFSAAAADVGSRPGPARDLIAFILNGDAEVFERPRRAVRERTQTGRLSIG